MHESNGRCVSSNNQRQPYASRLRHPLGKRVTSYTNQAKVNAAEPAEWNEGGNGDTAYGIERIKERKKEQEKDGRVKESSQNM